MYGCPALRTLFATIRRTQVHRQLASVSSRDGRTTDSGTQTRCLVGTSLAPEINRCDNPPVRRRHTGNVWLPMIAQFPCCGSFDQHLEDFRVHQTPGYPISLAYSRPVSLQQ